MLRWAGVVLTILSSAGIGVYYSSVAKMRLDNLKDVRKVMMRLRGEISYAGTPLPEAIAHASDYAGRGFAAFYRALVGRLGQMEGETFPIIWKACVERELGDVCLTKKDRAELVKFGEGLGYLDKAMQTSTIDWYVSELDQQIHDCNGELGKKVKLYNTLGFMGGIFLVVLLWG